MVHIWRSLGVSSSRGLERDFGMVLRDIDSREGVFVEGNAFKDVAVPFSSLTFAGADFGVWCALGPEDDDLVEASTLLLSCALASRGGNLS